MKKNNIRSFQLLYPRLALWHSVLSLKRGIHYESKSGIK